MQLFCVNNSNTYGTIGDETGIPDKYGRPLHVGDVVLLSHKKSKLSHLRFVAQESTNNVYYVMGDYNKTDGFEYELKIPYTELKNGFKLGDVKYTEKETV